HGGYTVHFMGVLLVEPHHTFGHFVSFWHSQYNQLGVNESTLQKYDIREGEHVLFGRCLSFSRRMPLPLHS
ncbi:MAG: hypothetical protein MR387_12385, partial [Phocaeicola plebeius]|nr:hypothetical protein [Phocaeicola plebeius]